LIGVARYIEVLKGAGHFPFWDSPDAFASALTKAFVPRVPREGWTTRVSCGALRSAEIHPCADEIEADCRHIEDLNNI